MKISNKTYDSLKFLAQILLPALGTLYFALAGIWGLPAADEVVGTVLAVDTFLGVILGISTNSYNNSDEKYSGVIAVGDELQDGMQNFHMQLPLDAKDVINKKEIVLKVHK